MTGKKLNFFHVLLTAHNHSADGASLSVNKLCSRMLHKVGPEFNRPLQIGRGKAVVNYKNQVVCLCQLTGPLRVNQVQPRFRGSFKEQYFSVWFDELLLGIGLINISIGKTDSPSRQNLTQYLVGRSKQRARCQHVIAVAQQAGEAPKHTCHS